MTDKPSGPKEQPKPVPSDRPASTPESSPHAETQGSGPQLPGADMQAFIGRQLRAVYDDVAKQPVPDRFIELMKQLEGKPLGG